MERIRVGGLEIAFERSGSGPALLLLGGFVGDRLSTWSPQIEEFAADHTVIAWDTPGNGHSDPVPGWFRLSQYADCLAMFIRALRLDRPHLVGLSSGGALALEFFRRYRVTPRSLVLAGAYAGWAGSLGREQAAERLQRSLELSELPAEEFAGALMPSMFSKPSAISSGSQQVWTAIARFAASVRATDRAGFATMARSMAEADLNNVLPTIDVPTLVVQGEDDTRSPLSVGQALHEGIPGSRLVVLPGVGHVSPVQAAELFNREVGAFLREVDSRPAKPG